MKIAYVSDVHLEFGSKVPGLLDDDINLYVLAGDITTSCSGTDRVADNLVEWQGKKHPGPYVMHTYGNHEFYDGLKEPKPSVEHTILNGVHILTATLWSDGEKADPKYTRGMADFRYIKNWTPQKMSTIHKIEQQKIAEYCAFLPKKEKLLVITHHLPSELCIVDQYKGDPFNHFFASNTIDYIYDKTNRVPDLWIYGHTHTGSDIIHPYGTRMVCNPHGYQGSEVFGDTKWKVVEV